MLLIPDNIGQLDQADAAYLSTLRSGIRAGDSGGMKYAGDYCAATDQCLDTLYPVCHRMTDLCSAMGAARSEYVAAVDDSEKEGVLDEFLCQVDLVLAGHDRDENGYSLWHHAVRENDQTGIVFACSFYTDFLYAEPYISAWFDPNNASGLPAEGVVCLNRSLMGFNFTSELGELYDNYTEHQDNSDPVVATTGRTVWEQVALYAPKAAAAFITDGESFRPGEHDVIGSLKSAFHNRVQGLHFLVLALKDRHPQVLEEAGEPDLIIDILRHAISHDDSVDRSSHKQAADLLHDLELSRQVSRDTRLSEPGMPGAVL